MGARTGGIHDDIVLNGVEWPADVPKGSVGVGGGSGRVAAASAKDKLLGQRSIYSTYGQGWKYYYVFVVSFTNFIIPFSGGRWVARRGSREV
jgi:hypothetical protein